MARQTNLGLAGFVRGADLVAYAYPARGYIAAPALPIVGPPETKMLQLKPLDSAVPIFQQISAEQAPVVLVNLFDVAEADIPSLLDAWTADAHWMKQQPGYISTQLHRGIAGSTVFMNYAVWESVAHFRAAFNHPEFKSALAHYPSSAVASPHLFERLTVANLCVGP